jgi:cytochrome c oxidase assembly factor CtaG
MPGGWVQVLLSVALIGVYAVPYALRARTLARRGRPVPTWRLVCFGTALLLLVVAVSPPVDAVVDRRLSAHMAEHLVIGDIAPLLIVLGLTGPLLAPLLRQPGVKRLQVLAHPVVAVAIWSADLYLWHLRFAYEAAVDHELVHVAQHASFFTCGVLLWMALLGPLPKPAWFGTGAKVGYVIVVRIIATMLAYGFIWAGDPFYPHYVATAAAAGRSALADQSVAGAVMLVEQSVVMVGLFAWLVARAILDAGRRQELAELAAARGVNLDARRIARAVAADHGDALSRRLTEAPPS